MKRKLAVDAGLSLLRKIRPVPVAALKGAVPFAPDIPEGSKSLSTAARDGGGSAEDVRPVRRLIVGLGNPGKEYEMTRHNVGFMVLRALMANTLPYCLHDAATITGPGKDLQFAMDKKLNSEVARVSLAFHAGDVAVSEKEQEYRGRGEKADAQARRGRLGSLGLDLVDRKSARRRQRTADEGVAYPLVDATLLLPQTFMNLSGTPCRKVVDRERLRLKKNPLALNRGDEILVIADDADLPFGELRLKAKGGDGGHNGLKDIGKRLGTTRFGRLRVGVGPAGGSVAGGSLHKHVLGKFNHAEQARLPELLAHAGECLRVYLFRGLQAASEVTNGRNVFAGEQKQKQ